MSCLSSVNNKQSPKSGCSACLHTSSACARPPRLFFLRQGLCRGLSAHFWTQVRVLLLARVSALTGGVVHRSSAVASEQGGIQVRVCLLQGHTQVEEMVALLVHQHLQKVVDFLCAGRTVLVQLEPIELTQGTRNYQQLDQSVRIRYGLQ